jgi:hypothetical protein
MQGPPPQIAFLSETITDEMLTDLSAEDFAIATLDFATLDLLPLYDCDHSGANRPQVTSFHPLHSSCLDIIALKVAGDVADPGPLTKERTLSGSAGLPYDADLAAPDSSTAVGDRNPKTVATADLAAKLWTGEESTPTSTVGIAPPGTEVPAAAEQACPACEAQRLSVQDVLFVAGFWRFAEISYLLVVPAGLLIWWASRRIRRLRKSPPREK